MAVVFKGLRVGTLLTAIVRKLVECIGTVFDVNCSKTRLAFQLLVTFIKQNANAFSLSAIVDVRRRHHEMIF